MRVVVDFGTLRQAGAFSKVLGDVDEDLNVPTDACHAVRIAHVAILCTTHKN